MKDYEAGVDVDGRVLFPCIENAISPVRKFIVVRGNLGTPGQEMSKVYYQWNIIQKNETTAQYKGASQKCNVE